MQLLKSEYRQWLDHPVTKKIVKELTLQRDLEKKDLISGSHLENHAKLANSIGIIYGLEKFLNLNIQEMLDDENEGSGT